MDARLRELYQACDPFAPAEENQYQDTSSARGSGMVSAEVRRRLDMMATDKHCCFLFTGHSGCGKSSELRHLSHLLRSEAPSRYYPVLVDATAYVGHLSIESSDLLLAVCCELAIHLRKEKLGDLSRELDLFLRQTLSMPVMHEGKAGEVTAEQLGEIKAKLARLLQDSDSKARYLDGINQRMEGAYHAMLALVKLARTMLSDQGKGELLVIVDGADGIDSLKSDAQARRLFIEDSGRLRSLPAHVIYTVPLLLARTRTPELRNVLYTGTFILPMVKVFHRPLHGGWQAPYQPGVDLMKDLLRRRLAKPVALDEVIDPAALDLLIRYSGGDIRTFMGLIQRCTVTPASACPLSEALAESVIDQFSAEYILPDRYWPKLARLDLKERDGTINLADDEDYRQMLVSLLIDEYVNGTPPTPAAKGTGVPLGNLRPWYAVNPLLRRFPEFQRAKAALDHDPGP